MLKLACRYVILVKKEGGFEFVSGGNVHDQIKAMIVAQGWTITKVVSKMNETRPIDKQTTVQNISNKLTRGTIKFSEVTEIAKIVGCTLLWEPIDTMEVAQK